MRFYSLDQFILRNHENNLWLDADYNEVVETNNPLHSTLIMLFSTCFSRYAIDAFSIRDFPQKRILIAIADYDGKGWAMLGLRNALLAKEVTL